MPLQIYGMLHVQAKSLVTTVQQKLHTTKHSRAATTAFNNHAFNAEAVTLDRGQALGWLQDGTSGQEDARRLRMSHSVIQRLHERFQATGSADDRPRSLEAWLLKALIVALECPFLCNFC